MVSLQPKLNLRVAQRQILTPGLMQMVSVLALNKLELKDMIQTEITENPVLEELEEGVPLLDHVAGREADRELASVPAEQSERTDPRTDPFEEIDFGSYFQEYLDPGFRSPQSFELTEKPSIENYLTQPGSLMDHLEWQVGSLSLLPLLREAVDYVLGNLDEDGYCAATMEELHAGWLRELTAACLGAGMLPDAEALLTQALTVVRALDPVGVAACDLRECLLLQITACRRAAEGKRQSGAARAAPSGATLRYACPGLPHCGLLPAAAEPARPAGAEQGSGCRARTGGRGALLYSHAGSTAGPALPGQ